MIKLHKNIVLLSLFISSAHAAQQRTYPLHEAVEQGIHRVRQLLLDKTIDINLQNRYGDTAFLLAVKKGNKEIVQLLIDNGSDVNLQNNNGDTPLSYLDRTFFEQATITHLVKNTQTPSLDTHLDLLKEDYLQSLFKQIHEGKCNQGLRQYMDILLVNKMLNSIKEDQKKIFYQACCDAYMTKEMKLRLIEGYLRKIYPEYCENQNLPWQDKIQSYLSEDTYPAFLKSANHAENRFLFEVTKQAKNYEAVATENLALSMAKHKIVQDAEKVHNQPLSVIMRLLLAWRWLILTKG